jgi:hypothetical protein
MTGWLLTPLLVVLLAVLLAGGAIVAQAGVASAGTAGDHGRVLFVSASAKHYGANRSCAKPGFKKIQSAVDAASPGATVVICRGTYHEQVVVFKPLTLDGQLATIDESGVNPWLKVTVPHLGTVKIFAAVVIVSSDVRFTGLRVQHAKGEGILAAGLGRDISGITISHSAVVFNDLGFGFPKPKSSYFECAAAGQVPGDCGEGIHFTAVADSAITHDVVANNSGGVLLSDDTGPTHGNLVADNYVTQNFTDCGITVPGHNPGALNAKGKPAPQVAGVYDNVIRDNVVTFNGLKGEGAGVLFANATAGTASYDNLVEGNYIAGNELAGVTMHAHTIRKGQHEDLSGNNVIGNVIGRNNIGGDPLDFPASPKDDKTTGILVFSGGTHITVRIAFNHISVDTIGIWLSKAVSASGLKTNRFTHVSIHILAGQ